MSHQLPEDPDLTAEAEQQLQELLGGLPTLPIPPEVYARISARIGAEATTRAALLGADADGVPTPTPFDKHAPIETDPVDRDLDELDQR